MGVPINKQNMTDSGKRKLPELTSHILTLTSGEEILLDRKGLHELTTEYEKRAGWTATFCTDIAGRRWAVNAAHIVCIMQVLETDDYE